MQNLVPLLAVLLAAPTLARAEGEKIVAIDVSGNSKTDPQTVKLIAGVSVGDTWTYDLGVTISERLVSSGLFRDDECKAFTAPHGEGVKLTIIAPEKHSWVIGPTFYNQPGNIGGGFGFGEANLFGLNQKLVLYAQYATAESMLFAVYLNPSIHGSRFYWRVDTYLRHANITEYAPPTEFLAEPGPLRDSTLNYLNGGLLVGANLWRGMAFDARLRGAYVFFRNVEAADGVDPATLPQDAGGNVQAPQEDGWDVTYEVRLIRDRRAHWHGVTTGSKFSLWWEQALPQLGSDVDYYLSGGSLTVGWKYWREHNLLLKTGLAHGKHVPFQQEYTAGGAPGLRGYRTWQFRGDTKLAATTEYSVPLFRVGPFLFRGLAFWDSAFTTYVSPEPDGPDAQRHYLPGQTDDPRVAQWRNGLGGGFRVYMKSIVLPLVGVDVGYGLEANDYHVYLALGLVEL